MRQPGGAFFSAEDVSVCFQVKSAANLAVDHGVGHVKDEIENMAARARRGALDCSERRQLGVALDNSLEARMLYRAGCRFDALDNVLPGDDNLAERITRRVMASKSPASGQRSR